MLELKRFKADIESAPYGSEKGLTIEFYAAGREAAEERLNWLLEGYRRKSDYYRKRNWFNLEEIEEENI